MFKNVFGDYVYQKYMNPYKINGDKNKTMNRNQNISDLIKSEEKMDSKIYGDVPDPNSEAYGDLRESDSTSVHKIKCALPPSIPFLTI